MVGGWGKGGGRGGPVDSWMRASFRGFLRRDAIVGDGVRWLPLGVKGYRSLLVLPALQRSW